MREGWNLGGGPILSMTELLEEHGIKVLKPDFPRAVDGLTCFVHRTDETAVPVVVCSTGISIERQRFTLAHELGHLVMDIPAGMPEETICDRFASATLVPEDELVREVGRRRLDFGFCELVEIKKIFGVSAAALVMRMRDLGIISEATVTRIFRGIGRSWRTQEPCPLAQPESPKRFRRLCLRALVEDVISESKAAELLGMRVSDIERVMVGTADGYGMQILVSDSSVLIEFSKRNLLAKIFQLRFQFAVLDLLFNEELIDLGRYDRQDLVRLGLRVEALDPEGLAAAIAYQSRRRALSLLDCFALALAYHSGYTLLTEDRRMRSFALEEGIQHYDLLWIIDQMHPAAILDTSQVATALEAMFADPRSPVPKQELARRLRNLAL